MSRRVAFAMTPIPTRMFGLTALVRARQVTLTVLAGGHQVTLSIRPRLSADQRRKLEEWRESRTPNVSLRNTPEGGQ